MLDLADTTPHGRRTVLLVTALAGWTWSLVAYVVLLTMLVLGIGTGGGTAGMLMLTLQAIALLFLVVLVGVVVGSRTTGARVPPTLVPPALAIAVFAVLNVIDLQEGPIGRLSPVYADIFYRYRLEPNVLLLVAVTTALCATSLVLLATALGSPVGRHPGLALVAVVAAGASATALMAAPAGDTRLRAGGQGSCRSEQQVELCVWPGPGVPVTESLSALVQVRGVAATVIAVPTEFHEAGLRGEAGSRVFDVPADSASGAGFSALAAVVPPACDRPTQAAADELTGLLAQRLDPGAVDPRGPWAAGIEIADLPLGDQRAWASSRVELLERCEQP